MKTREQKQAIVERFTQAQMNLIEDLHAYQNIMEQKIATEYQYWETQVSLMPQRTNELKKDQAMAITDLKYERDTKVFEYTQKFTALQHKLLEELESD